MFTLSDVQKLIIPANFGTLDSYRSSSIMEVAEQLPADVQWKYGMTKFVIMLNEEEIVKIPFNGEFQESYGDEEDYFRNFHDDTDYCSVEEQVYRSAYERGLDIAFAETKFICKTSDGTPVYISERVIPLDSNESTNYIHSSVDSREKARNLLSESRVSFPREWLASAIEIYGVDFVSNLIDFIEDSDLWDFHRGNVGYRRDGSPVLLDYSSYDD